MKILLESDQHQILSQYEKETAQLMGTSNQGELALVTLQYKAQSLLEEVRSIAKPHYFEEDLLQRLHQLKEELELYINSVSASAKLLPYFIRYAA